MPEIGSSGLMSGDGKRGVGHRPQATAPILDSTNNDLVAQQNSRLTAWSLQAKLPKSHTCRFVAMPLCRAVSIVDMIRPSLRCYNVTN
jgi:hypothetical protein